jgi:hypothetical protein
MIITEKLQKSNAKYKGKIINFRYQPMFFDKTDLEKFDSICQMMMNIIGKCTNEYLMNPEFRKYFGFSEQMEELILCDPGYDIPAPITRLDIFYDGEFKFCELNGDGTSAMNEANTLERIFMESEIIGELKKKYKLGYYELFQSWLIELLEIYRIFGGRNKPNIAIIDFLGLGTIEEFEVFKSVFEENGYKTVICDPRELKYQNGKLFYHDFKIDLIYRRAVNREVEKRLAEVPDFIKAYKDKAVCVVGPFRSQIMHNKIFFSLLSDPGKTSFLNDEERNFIEQHIPKTWPMSNAPQDVWQNKDCYLIKPRDLYGGKNVICGLDCSISEWQHLLREHAEKEEILIQEFCNFTTRELPIWKENEFKFEPYKTTLGLFCYNGNFRGLYSRVSQKNVIAGVRDSITLPSLITD